MDLSSIILSIAQMFPGFLLAVVVHEWAHAMVADKFGDTTARAAGRLTLNPAAHFDLVGTVIIPIVGAIYHFPIIGWAKPVPVNMRNFKKIRAGMFWVSFAGPLSNIFLSISSSFLLAFIAVKVSPDFSLKTQFMAMLQYSIQINVVLAVFNLLPIPPADGGRMVSSFLKGQALYKFDQLERYSFFIFMGLLLINTQIPILDYLFYPAYALSQFFTMYFLHLMS